MKTCSNASEVRKFKMKTIIKDHFFPFIKLSNNVLCDGKCMGKTCSFPVGGWEL